MIKTKSFVDDLRKIAAERQKAMDESAAALFEARRAEKDRRITEDNRLGTMASQHHAVACRSVAATSALRDLERHAVAEAKTLVDAHAAERQIASALKVAVREAEDARRDQDEHARRLKQQLMSDPSDLDEGEADTCAREERAAKLSEALERARKDVSAAERAFRAAPLPEDAAEQLVKSL